MYTIISTILNFQILGAEGSLESKEYYIRANTY
jgi:hypothetical protein